MAHHRDRAAQPKCGQGRRPRRRVPPGPAELTAEIKEARVANCRMGRGLSCARSPRARHGVSAVYRVLRSATNCSRTDHRCTTRSGASESAERGSRADSRTWWGPSALGPHANLQYALISERSLATSRRDTITPGVAHVGPHHPRRRPRRPRARGRAPRGARTELKRLAPARRRRPPPLWRGLTVWMGMFGGSLRALRAVANGWTKRCSSIQLDAGSLLELVEHRLDPNRHSGERA